MKANALTYDSNTSILLKAPFGYGKTLAAASFALAGPVYLAYFDKKKPIELKTFFERKGEKGRKILDNIEYDVYGSHNANEYLNKLITMINNCRYTAVITDSVTNLTASAVNWSLGFRDPDGAKRDKLNPKSVQLIPDFDEYKVETSLVTQALDILKTLPCHVIWTAHPLPTLKVEGSGTGMRVSKTNSIVTYGSKVAGIVPGNFTEIYHFSKEANWGAAQGTSNEKYIVSVRAIGDEFAKTALFDDSVKEFDITDKFFYEVWKEELDKQQERNKQLVESEKQSQPSQPQTEWKL